jgi:hypothetical protein
MPVATTLPAAILETILTRLAAFFLTGAAGDLTAARQAAAQMLGAHRPETEDEFRIAANIIGFNFQSLEALSQAAAPDLPITRILRLRGSAVSLSRESREAECRLDQLQKARRQGVPAQPAEIRAEPEPKTEKVIADTRKVTVAAKASGQTWTQAYEQRQREARIAASLKQSRGPDRRARQHCDVRRRSRPRPPSARPSELTAPTAQTGHPGAPKSPANRTGMPSDRRPSALNPRK